MSVRKDHDLRLVLVVPATAHDRQVVDGEFIEEEDERNAPEQAASERERAGDERLERKASHFFRFLRIPPIEQRKSREIHAFLLVFRSVWRFWRPVCFSMGDASLFHLFECSHSMDRIGGERSR